MADGSRRFRVTCSAMIFASVIATACGSETPQPSGAVLTPAVQATSPRSPTSTDAASRAFTSELYGFELVLPSRWQIRAASTTWVTGVLEGRCPPPWDCFSDTTDDRTLAVAAIGVARLPKNTTLEEWQARIYQSAPPCEDSDPPSETTLDGERALTWTTVCEFEALKGIKLAALHGTRAYMFLFISPTTTSLESDQAVFESIMSTFHFAAR
jgi:hypothetical protein